MNYKLLKSQIYKYLVIFTITLFVVSCSSSKKVVYFQEIEGVEINDSLINFEAKLQKGDALNIMISAVDIEATMPFNLYVGAGLNARSMGYIIDVKGEINFPIIGKVKAEGLTISQMTDRMIKKISDYIKNPVVNVGLINFKITVLGEVSHPGTHSIPNGKITIIQALGIAGDLNILGKRKNVLLIREYEGKRVFVNIDLTNKKLFNSPYYYLVQNDVIYVEPSSTKITTSKTWPSLQMGLTALSTAITLYLLFTR